MIAAPELFGAGAVKQLFGVADAGAEELLVVPLQVEAPDFLAVGAGLVAEIGRIADGCEETFVIDENRSPPMPAKARQLAGRNHRHDFLG